MHVQTTSLSARVPVVEDVVAAATWDVDVVSGASVAIVDAPGAPDVITSATILDDVRHVVALDLAAVLGGVELSAGASVGAESDYRSTGARASASTRLPGTSAELALAGSISFDDVCDAKRDASERPVDRLALASSRACFSRQADVRRARTEDVRLSLVQPVSPVWLLQGVFALSRTTGFQSNPYREVWLGPFSAQEHHPTLRTRGAIGLGSRVWVDVLRSAFQCDLRLYQDDWALRALTAKIALEHEADAALLGAAWRIRGHVRAHVQSSAHFYSDDYASQPTGEYFTGDRELSAIRNLAVGARVGALWREGDVSLWLATEWVHQALLDFHYGSIDAPNANYLVTSLGVTSRL